MKYIFLFLIFLIIHVQNFSQYVHEPCSDWLPEVVLKTDSANGKAIYYFMDYLEESFIKDTNSVYFPRYLWIELHFSPSISLPVNNKEESEKLSKWLNKCYRLEVYYSLKYGKYVESHIIFNPIVSKYKIYEGWINFLEWWKYCCDEWFKKVNNILPDPKYFNDIKVIIGAVPFKDVLIEKNIFVGSLDSCEFNEYHSYFPEYYLNQIIIEFFLFDEIGSLGCKGENVFPVSGCPHFFPIRTGWSEW